MTTLSLAEAYLRKARVRLEVLDLLIERGAYSDVVREAQEVVELALKGLLRYCGIEPPKWHDVGGFLLEHVARLPLHVRADAERLASISRWLRKERELSFYGDVDFVPTEQYGPEDAERARSDARFAVEAAGRCMPGHGSAGGP